MVARGLQDLAPGAWQFKVALEVLYHYFEGPSSPLAAYIRSLPGVCPGVPGPQVAMLFPEQDLQELQYQPLINDAGSQAYWWKQYSSEVLGKLEGSCEEGAFGGRHVTAEQLGQMPAGAPILLKYGSHDNANLLLSYGFVLPDNPADRYSFTLDMDLLLVSIG
eukprot:gene10558-10718_t